MPILNTTCACAFGAIASPVSNADVNSKVFIPRMCDPFRCLRFHLALCGLLAAVKELSGGSNRHKGPILSIPAFSLGRQPSTLTFLTVVTAKTSV